MKQPIGEEDPQSRIEKLVEEETKALLYVPESYESVELKVDSLTSNVFSVENINKTKRIKELVGELDYSISNERVKEYYLSELKKNVNEFIVSLSEEPSGGWGVYNRFRVNDSEGNLTFGEFYHVLNHERTEILFSIDAKDKAFETYVQTLETIKSLDIDSISDRSDALMVVELLSDNYRRHRFDKLER